LNKLGYPIVLDSSNKEQVERLQNLRYGSLEPVVNNQNQVEGFFPIKRNGQECAPSIGYILYSLHKDFDDYCDFSQPLIYKQSAPLLVPFMSPNEARELELQQDLGVKTFSKTDIPKFLFHPIALNM